MSYVALAIGMFLIGLYIGMTFTLRHQMDILKRAFKDMTEEELIKWYHKKIKPE